MRRLSPLHNSLTVLRDLPAFQAGLFVMAAIVAALCNFGLFAILLAARLSLDAALWAANGTKQGRVLWGVMRASILDFVLLVIGLNLAVFGSNAPGFIAGSTVDLALWTVLLGLGLLVPKLTIFLRFVRHLTGLKMPKHRKGPLSSLETIGIFIIIAGILLLTASPRLVAGGAKTVLMILRKQIIPWRL